MLNIVVGAVLSTAALLAILVVPSLVHAQAAVDQYVPSVKPSGTGGDDPGAPPAGGSTSAGETSAAGQPPREAPTVPKVSSGSVGGSDLPGGYPVTNFVALVAALLLGAMLVRLFWQALGSRR